MEMRFVSIALGSNQGNREANIQNALDLISAMVGPIAACSPFYENEAQGFESSELFLNGCILVESDLDALDMLHILKTIEKRLGRLNASSEGYASRPIDLDIVLIEDYVLKTPDLEIPHPRFRERMFVLKPLSDIQFHAIDPITLKSIGDLLNQCEDSSRLTLRELNVLR
jgi:deoxyguanosine kinase